MSDEKLDLIIAQNEEILANQNALMGGAPPPDTSGEAWITNDVGMKLRNPDYEGWNADLWDLGQVNSITQVDIAGIPKRNIGAVTGTYNTQWGNWSYDLLIIPRQELGMYIRATGNSVLRVLNNKPTSNGGTKHVVMDACTLAGGSIAVPNGSGDIWILQTSERTDCGSVYTDTL